MFEPHQVEAAVTQALREADIPDGQENAIIAVATRDFAGNLSIQGVYAHRISRDNWNLHLSGMIGMDHEKHLEAGIAVKTTWLYLLAAAASFLAA